MPAANIRPLTRFEYDQLIEADCLVDEKVELIHGFIVRMSPQKPPHASAVQTLSGILFAALMLPGRASVRVQLPLALGNDSEPEPDLAVVAVGSYRQSHPTSALLVIEVASSLMTDRREKAALYAEHGVPEYWIVDTANELVEVHTEIVDSTYTRVTPYRVGEVVSGGTFEDLKIPVAEIFK